MTDFDPLSTIDGSKRPRSPRSSRDPRSWAKPTAVKRAESRLRRVGTPRYIDGEDVVWVEGSSSFGDNYDEYIVTKTVEGGKVRHRCSCMGHMGGQYRRLCTHVLAYLIARHDGLMEEPCPIEQSSSSPSLAPTPEAPAFDFSSPIGEPVPSAFSDDGFDRPISPVPSEVSVSLAVSPEDDDGTWLSPTEAFPGVDPSLWPSWLTAFRPLQVQAVHEIIAAFEAGNKVVGLDAPTGAGKSLIAYTVGRVMAARSLYLSETKLLQDQFLSDFGDVGAATIKGRANYIPQKPIDIYGESVTCSDCDKRNDACSYCPDAGLCPYDMAKREAVMAPVAVANYAYALNEWQSAHSKFLGRELVVCDEADVLEGQLMGHVEVTIPERTRQALRLTQPRILSSVESQAEWLTHQAIPAIRMKADAMREELRGRSDIKLRRRLKSYRELAEKLEMVAADMTDPDSPNSWVMTGYEKRRGMKRGEYRKGNLTFKPIKVAAYGEDLLWRKGRRFLLMSATIISMQSIMESLGYTGQYETVVCPMPFPAENRPIIVCPVAPMSRKLMSESLPDMQDAVTVVLNAFPEDRTIIHTVSYALMWDIFRGIKDRVRRPFFIYKDSAERSGVIEEFKATPGAVLLGPSFTRGFDFKGEEARINIVCKVPFPNMGDDQINARMHEGAEGQRWYTTLAIRELVQMTGRTTRTDDDWSVSFVLDGLAARLISENRRLIPEWWHEARRSVKPRGLERFLLTGSVHRG